MFKTVLLVFLIIGVGKLLKELKRKGGKSRVAANGIVVLMLLFLGYVTFISPGFRFTSDSSAKANAFIDSNDQWVAKIEYDGNEFHTFYDSIDEKYETVFVEKLLVGYKSQLSTHLFSHNDDDIRTIGTIKVADNDNYYSAFMVEIDDPLVHRLAILDHNKDVLVSIDAKPKELNSFVYEFTNLKDYNNFQLVALDRQGNKVFYYGYENGSSVSNPKDYKWHRF